MDKGKSKEERGRDEDTYHSVVIINIKKLHTCYQNSSAF
jgi:hypothetical protein